VKQNEIARATANWQQTAKGRRLYERSMRFWSKWSDGHPGPEHTAHLEELIVKHEDHEIMVAIFRELIERRTGGNGGPAGDALSRHGSLCTRYQANSVRVPLPPRVRPLASDI
jgi:hypothetical protein